MDRFEEAKLRVKDGNDLVALLESYLPLRASGRNLVALCPFHQEKTPSFTVYPDSQHFKCYGCGKAGDVFTFVMEREGVSFRESMEILAQRAGISLEGVFDRSGGERGPRVDPYAVLAAVQGFFAAALRGPDGARGLAYLRSRGLEAAIEPFGLGVHPAAPGALLAFARQRRLPLAVLEQAGLLRSGGFEPFRGRLMFPIADERGRVVGFGGRLLEEGRPKYLNSPESTIFHKRRVLYGLRHAKQAGERRIVVMEGYTDVIACHLAGYTGAVATLGTALTADHGRVLLRYATEGVVVLFDGDAAGRTAAERAYGELARSELPARIAILPDGMDPADLLSAAPARSAEECARGREEFGRLLDGAEDALATWFRLKRSRLDLTQEAHVLQVIGDCGVVLAGLADAVQRDLLLERMARHLGLAPESLRKSLGRRGRRPIRRGAADAADRETSRAAAGSAPGPSDAPAATPLSKSDQELIACVLARPALAARAMAEAAEMGRLEVVLAAAAEAAADHGEPQAVLRALFTRFAEDRELAALLAAAADLAPAIRAAEEALELVLRQRRSYLARQAAQRTRYRLQAARSSGNKELEDALTRRYLAELRQQHRTDHDAAPERI